VKFIKRKKGSALGVFMIGPLVGSAIAPAIVVPIALALKWRYSFLTSSPPMARVLTS